MLRHASSWSPRRRPPRRVRSDAVPHRTRSRLASCFRRTNRRRSSPDRLSWPMAATVFQRRGRDRESRAASRSFLRGGDEPLGPSGQQGVRKRRGLKRRGSTRPAATLRAVPYPSAEPHVQARRSDDASLVDGKRNALPRHLPPGHRAALVDPDHPAVRIARRAGAACLRSGRFRVNRGGWNVWGTRRSRRSRQVVRRA